MAPANLIDLTIRPTKVDRPSDVTGLVDVGDLSTLGLTQADAVAESSFFNISKSCRAASILEPFIPYLLAWRRT